MSAVCFCSKCRGTKTLTIRTLKTHIQSDKDVLAISTFPALQNALNEGIAKTQDSILSLAIQSSKKSNTTGAPAPAPLESVGSTDGISEVFTLSSTEAPEILDKEHETDVIMLDDEAIIQDEINSESEDDYDVDPIQQFEDNVPDVDEDELEELDDDMNNISPNLNTQIPISTPEILKQLRKDLLGDYQLPPHPIGHEELPVLSKSEILSLQHFTAWNRSNGTVVAYNKHKEVLENATHIPVLSLFRVRRLAHLIVQFHPTKVDMCPKTCIAYTGEYKELTQCPYVLSSGAICGVPRYKGGHRKKQPQAQVTVLPVMDTIRALFSNEDTSRLMRHRDQCLKAALDVVGRASTGSAPDRRIYSDYGNSFVHTAQHQTNGFFKDSRDVSLVLSTDGAQLTLKKHSNTWLLILVILNLPPEIRYTSGNVILNLATPGPNSPGDIESFMRPLFEEMACASEGIWIWDALDSSYFVNRAYIAMGCGDMLGSAKINGMAGHTAVYGDRFTLVKGARSSTKKGSKSIYYPMAPPDNEKYNPSRQSTYDLNNLPIRDHNTYLETISQLYHASTDAARIRITRATGVSRLPLCAASPLFYHPVFFPLDPFHLFYENCMAFIWDLWTSISKPSERIHLSPHKVELLGRQIPLAMATLPPAFCGPVRDPNLKRQSQYKVYEWMALLHWYIVPIGIEISMDASILENFSDFVYIIETSMTIGGHTEISLSQLQQVIIHFLQQFEALYVGKNPENISRCRLCIFQLIHVPLHIKWNGSIRLGSQATCERSIGEVEHRIRSRKAPFQNLTNIIVEKELIRILHLYYPSLSQIKPLDSPPLSEDTLPTPNGFINPFTQKLPARRADKALITEHLTIISTHVQLSVDSLYGKYQRWGKAKLSNGRTLRSQLSDVQSPVGRAYRWFEARIPSDNVQGPRTIFGEVLAFYSIQYPDRTTQCLAVFIPLIAEPQILRQVHGRWSTKLACIDIKYLVDIVGIWEGIVTKKIYIIRKHPALALLSSVELGNDQNDKSTDPDDEVLSTEFEY